MSATVERLSRRKQQDGREGGFTLIELLIVIVILGILAAIIVFAVGAVTGQSANAACQSDFKNVQVAAEAYKAQMGTYPGDIAALAMPTKDPQGDTVGPWLKSVPNSSHYSMTIDSATGDITVTPKGGTANAASTDAVTACTGVS
jgi:type II secretion system protein G